MSSVIVNFTLSRKKLLVARLISPFLANITLLYPLKTSENQKFSDVFREYRSEILVENGLSKSK